MSVIAIFRQPRLKVMHTFDSEASQCRADIADSYYRSLKTLKAPADLIRFLGSLIGEMPENAEPPSGNEWCKDPT